MIILVCVRRPSVCFHNEYLFSYQKDAKLDMYCKFCHKSASKSGTTLKPQTPLCAVDQSRQRRAVAWRGQLPLPRIFSILKNSLKIFAHSLHVNIESFRFYLRMLYFGIRLIGRSLRPSKLQRVRKITLENI